MNKQKQKLLTYAIIGISLIVFGQYSTTMNYAYATSVLSITMPNSGATQYAVWQNNVPQIKKAWFSVIEGGVIKVNIKESNSDVISSTISTIDSTTGGVMAYVDDQDAVYLFTNNHIFKIGNACNCFLNRFNTTSFNLVKDAYWDDTHNYIYALKSASYIRFTPAGFSDISATFSIKTPNFSFISNAAIDFDVDETSNFMFLTDGGDDNLIRINLNTDLNDLNVTAGTALTWYGVTVDDTQDTFYVTVSDNTQIRKYDQSGAFITVFSSSVAIPRFIELEPIARRFYVGHSASNQVTVWDADTNSQVGATLAVCTNPILHLSLKRTTTDARVIVPCGTGSVDSIITDTSVTVGLINPIACIETVAGSGIQDLCFNDTDGNGIPDNGALGGIGAYRSNQNVTSVGAQWLCAFGFNPDACTNQNAQTNGTGLLFLAMLIIISYAFLVFIHYQAIHMISKQQVQVMDAININPMLLLVMGLIDVGIAKGFNWISDLIFFTVIALLLGLAGFGIYKKVSGG